MFILGTTSIEADLKDWEMSGVGVHDAKFSNIDKNVLLQKKRNIIFPSKFSYEFALSFQKLIMSLILV